MSLCEHLLVLQMTIVVRLEDLNVLRDRKNLSKQRFFEKDESRYVKASHQTLQKTYQFSQKGEKQVDDYIAKSNGRLRSGRAVTVPAIATFTTEICRLISNVT